MGNKIYRSDEFDRYVSKEQFRSEYLAAIQRKKRKAMLILGGLALGAIIILSLIIAGIVMLFSGDDTSAIEDNLVKDTKVADTVPTSETAKYNFEDESVNSPDLSAALSYTGGKGLIVIDPGHGGYDSGCISSKAYEKEIDLEISLLLEKKLKEAGYEVFLTRTEDVFVGINDRADIANGLDNALLMVGIHLNSSESAGDSGVEVWTCNKEGNDKLADILAQSVSATTGSSNRGVQFRDNLVVCSKAKMPSVVLECGFLSNADEADKLLTEDYQEKIAEGVVDAVDSFLNNK